MPKRTDLKSILIIGAGPIVIGQGCEFDYSGVQACKALKAEGYRVILVNSNPATIMTDPSFADATYIEPINWQTIANIIAAERPDAVLPTMGGQVALNCALDLHSNGILQKYNIELIGATKRSIDLAEDREKFKETINKIGLHSARACIAHSLEEALQVQPQFGFPVVVRPSYTLGGSGGGIAYNQEEFREICRNGLSLSPTHELLIEESLLGWKEFELEVVRDSNDNCIVVCTIENIDPMGVHTGDSITVAPAQTLTDKEYQYLRNAALTILRAIGVDTGGANVQFALNPCDGRVVVVEMNPRVSRSSALASKATGFPIAKIAALLAVGYTLDELANDMTGGLIPASFEPSIDYVVTKIPRFNFDKFPTADQKLTTQMKSVGEVMAIGTTFAASLQKALCGLELKLTGLSSMLAELGVNVVKAANYANVNAANYVPLAANERAKLEQNLSNPNALRILYIADAMRCGYSVQQLVELTKIDAWFVRQIENLVNLEQQIASYTLTKITKAQLLHWKQQGFADSRLAELLQCSEQDLRQLRKDLQITATFRRIDSCAGEFPAQTAYFYRCFEEVCEANAEAAPNHANKIIILGSGPNRIGQGIEFDYCCVQAVQAVRAAGHCAIMINCNPETVSTDYDISDRLYFEPITLEAVLDVIACEQPLGVIVQFGGQTPLKLAAALAANGIKILGTQPDVIDLAEDRCRFQQLITRLGLRQPDNALANTVAEGVARAVTVGYPLIVRPSYVLGGQAMEVVYNAEELTNYLQRAVTNPDTLPILLDRFLDEAIEVDVDAIVDNKRQVFIAGIMEHIEQAGVHSGDSACCLPPQSLSLKLQQELRRQVAHLSASIDVLGLINFQFAIQGEDIFILEVNPRASRTIPFVSKAIGLPLAKLAVNCILGDKLSGELTTQSQLASLEQQISYYSVKHPVFPFIKFPSADPILGPEMKSTGETMGIATTFAEAYAKSLKATGLVNLKTTGGRVCISVRDADKPQAAALARTLLDLGFEIVATRGTAHYLYMNNLSCKIVNKVIEGRPHIVDLIKNNELDFIINTTEGRQSILDSHAQRCSAVKYNVNYTTNISTAKAIVQAMAYWQSNNVYKLQMLHDKEQMVAAQKVALQKVEVELTGLESVNNA